MTRQERKERERAQRRQVIVSAARELAEAEGWEAVTTRRLADRVEYSQPVLYSHFAGKDAIMAAVAVEGFAELAGGMRCTTPCSTRRSACRSPRPRRRPRCTPASTSCARWSNRSPAPTTRAC